MRIQILLAIVILLMSICYMPSAYCDKINLIDANKIIDDLKSEIKKNPKDIAPRIDLGATYFQLQEYALAKQQFIGVLAIDSNNTMAIYNLGKTLLVMGSTDEGIAKCEKAIELGFNDINVYQTLAHAYFNKNELKKSLKMYEAIKRLTPNDDRVYFACGLLYIELKDGWKAREEFKKAVELNPNNAEAHYELGWLYADYEPDYARQELEATLKLNPDHQGAKKELKRLSDKQ